MHAKPEPLSELLRAAVSGRASEAAWLALDDAVAADEAAVRTALEIAADDLPSLAAAIGDRRALATAVMTAAGEIKFADVAFQTLFAAGADFGPLLAGALISGSAVGLVEAGSGASFTAWAGHSDAAARWSLDPAAAAALAVGRDRLVVVVSAPSGSSELARRAARVLDLTALEARLAEALMFAPNLDIAAAEAGVGRETARDALRRLNAKAGVRRTPELVARLIEVMCAAPVEPSSDEEIAVRAFGLSPAEARVATLVARGLTTPEAAVALTVSAETVKTHLKTAFGKTGARRSKDLSRLFAEARELLAHSEAGESILSTDDDGGRLRVFATAAGRRIAFIDYGPYGVEPALIFHGAVSGRRLPPVFLAPLQAAGLRPIVIQRPGFGLTDPAGADYLATAAADVVAVIEHLKLGPVRLLAREEGVMAALELAHRRPDLIRHAVIVNPPPPPASDARRRTGRTVVNNTFLGNRKLVGAFAEFLRRQATAAKLESLLRGAAGRFEGDRLRLEDPALVAFVVRDIQALCARSVRGFIEENQAHARGWRPPRGLACPPLILAYSSGLMPDGPAWPDLPVSRTFTLENGGILTPFSHPHELTELLVADRGDA